MAHTSSDSLFNGLTFFGRLYGLPVTADSLQGLPLNEGKLTPELFARAAERVGLEAKLTRRNLSQLNESLCPVLLISKQGVPFILLGRKDDMAEVYVLDSGHGQMEVTWKEVSQLYSGYCILVKRGFKFEERADFAPEKPRKNWFWSTLWKFRSIYARVGVATLFINFFALTSSIFVMSIYDRVVPNEALDTMWVLAIGAIIAFGFDFVMKTLRTYFVDRAGHRADLIMGGMIYEQILGMKFSSRPSSAGAMASQVRAYEGLREFFASATLSTLIDLPFVFVFAAIIYLLGGVVAAPLMFGLILALAIGAFMQIPIGRAVSASYQAGNQRQALTVETLTALESIKTSGAESVLASKMESCVHESAKADAKSRMCSQTAVNLTSLIQHLVTVFIVILAFFQVTSNEMTMGAMIACVMMAGRGMAPIGMFTSTLTRLQQSRRSLKGLNNIMELPSDRPDEGKGVDLSVFNPMVELKHVSYAIQTGPMTPEIGILDNVTLKVPGGSRVGILGKIGSGKSTVIRTILGLYEPSQGVVELSRIDIRQLSPNQYRRNIGYIAQDTGLLYGTLRSNLTIGAPWLVEEDLRRAIDRAGLSDYVNSHPAGLDLPIAEGGASLSGGQRQLVCLARALVEEPDILVFDEPTSAMDPATERKFKILVDAYLKEDARRILIMATHKRSMLSLVNRVVVLDAGRVVSDGPKDKVISTRKREQPTAPGKAAANHKPVAVAAGNIPAPKNDESSVALPS